MEDFGLETEPPSANRTNQMKFQFSPAPGCAGSFEKKTSEYREIVPPTGLSSEPALISLIGQVAPGSVDRCGWG